MDANLVSQSPSLVGGADSCSQLSSGSNDIAESINAWRLEDINEGLAADFDDSLSGLGVELGAGAYNMSEALMALPPVFRQDSRKHSFQYVLGAATSPATKRNEETLTYLNQAQSYELKLKKLGDLSDMQGKYVKSVVRVVFHERRLQFQEHEYISTWKKQRPGERFLDIDVPLSYGLLDIDQDSGGLTSAEFVWDPTCDAAVFIRLHCISTEFTPKKHGGEKGVSLRVQVETYTYGDKGEERQLLHCASCQVKVFKPKGADRKHKTDREKIEKKSEQEKESFQRSYDVTVLAEVPVDHVLSATNHKTATTSPTSVSQSSFSTQQSPAFSSPSAGFKHDTSLSPGAPHEFSKELKAEGGGGEGLRPQRSPAPSQTSAQAATPLGLQSSSQPLSGAQLFSAQLLNHSLEPEMSSQHVAQWLYTNRFSEYTSIFQNFAGGDLLRLSKDDLIQICGLADGIRLNNAMRGRPLRPRLTLYVCQEAGHMVYHALYLENPSVEELRQKLAQLCNVTREHILELLVQGPGGISINATDQVLQNLADNSRFSLEGEQHETGGFRVLLKAQDANT